ncbi:MAG: hypothetical protein PHN55_12070 [Dysgonamonadaceae bacterium]|nr:hypothetical protein [Dysgonamonadaceae bacterium]
MKKYILLLLILSFASCKPKQVIHDRYITEIDSTAILTLKEVIAHQWQEIDRLKTTTDRLREENTTLLNETQQHEINYDTSGTVMDGKYPISSEVITISKSKLENTIKEQENIILEYKKEINSVTQRNTNLEYTVESLRNEIKELRSKSIPSFSLNSFIYGLVAGIILLIIVIVFLR